ncbi:DUF1801 domain-containing protein [Thalassotalea euphylliae]|uniref:DUF1801 domain-containing protein n=1 Tax=Thalassotalea euphylliae TaxID=1655234 RepID=A0A3E0TY74_9GAMM|nr:DUF1801 domain-containing protein [Thalassotalea euphylliae]REL29313.1 DUF1801 domain-containing protein [Thalassotalea euphylliae]
MVLKTQENDADVKTFIESVGHPQKVTDGLALLELMTKMTGKHAKMWGNSIVGFGKYTYQNTSGGGAWPITGFSPRKTALSVYIMPGFDEFSEELKRLGKHKLGKSCLYINKLADIDLDVLKTIVTKSIRIMEQRYPCE